jgi:hypothetical protein
MTTPETKLSQYHPAILIVGYDKNGKFGSSVCECKKDISAALPRYERFKIFFLRESTKDNDYWRGKAEGRGG